MQGQRQATEFRQALPRSRTTFFHIPQFEKCHQEEGKRFLKCFYLMTNKDLIIIIIITISCFFISSGLVETEFFT